jgi:hypothetical protein
MMTICIIVIGDLSIASRGSLCTMSFPPAPLVAVFGRPAKRERSTFSTHAPMATILKVSRVGFMVAAEYGIFSTLLRSVAKTK